jgi:hypothetical protein
MAECTTNEWGNYNNSDKKRAITTIFTKNQFVMLINKINQCQPNTFINHSFQNEANSVKIYDYLMQWRLKYWSNEDMSGFLCGMIGNMRKKRKVVMTTVMSYISEKTNNDVINIIEQYLTQC